MELQNLKVNRFANVVVLEEAVSALGSQTRDSRVDEFKGEYAIMTSPAGTEEKASAHITRLAVDTAEYVKAIEDGKIITANVSGKLFIAAVPEIENDEIVDVYLSTVLKGNKLGSAKIWELIGKRGYNVITGAASMAKLKLQTISGKQVEVTGLIYEGGKNVLESIEGGAKPAHLKAKEAEAKAGVAAFRETAREEKAKVAAV